MMQRLVVEHNVAARIVGSVLGFWVLPPFHGMVIETDGAVSGAVVFNAAEPPRNVWVTVVLSGPVGRHIVKGVLEYPFQTLDCARCSALTRASNAKAQKALGIVGFRREGVLRDWFVDEDAIVFGLTRREQKFVEV